MGLPTITYFGVVRSISSWAKVSREMVLALLQHGADVRICERRGFLYERNFELPAELSSRLVAAVQGPTLFTFEHPSFYSRLPQQVKKIGLLVYEFTRLPEEWVENINCYLDTVVVPSCFCRDVFLNSGVAEEKLKVLRYGYNPRYYFPAERRRGDAFKVLCVANPHKREGLEFLLEAFALAFCGQADVKLVLKMTYLPGRKIKPFEYPDLPGLVEAYRARSGMPPIEVISSKLSEAEMGALYRAADCYFSLSRCEAFGLCFLEALACGLPVVAVTWSGQGDFLNAQNAHAVRYELAPADGEEYQAAGEQLLARPDVDHAAELLREVYLRRTAGRNLLEPDPLYWQWKSIVREFVPLL